MEAQLMATQKILEMVLRSVATQIMFVVNCRVEAPDTLILSVILLKVDPWDCWQRGRRRASTRTAEIKMSTEPKLHYWDSSRGRLRDRS